MNDVKIPRQVRCCSGGSGGGRGGGGAKGAMAPPFKKKDLHAYFLTINNPALAILLSSSRGLHSGACDSSNNAHQKIK